MADNTQPPLDYGQPPTTPIYNTFTNAAVLVTAVFRLLPTTTQEQFWQQQLAVQSLLDFAPGCCGYMSGFTVEDYRDFTAIVGWVSVKAHREWREAQIKNPMSPLWGYAPLVEGEGEGHVVIKSRGGGGAIAGVGMEMQ
ncbi:hypothetical protein EDC01DRAFT_632199 [Geopyxis carbonaria]|nr:hypothetical protein EDC01DRAFT_632199 [Geopyxis carbonaria]